MSDIPTLETDALYNPENGWTGVVPIEHARDLGRRLTIARDALTMIIDTSPSLEHAERMAYRALEQTAPTP